ncbi:hypothetical protein EYD45_02260 [Hyunsoonleella flava]|uniref:Uncharacterized protein n=1 Tax=Hyunsoonleella flava TaxID=2527939 RepID=A0A4Q9FLR3_9FLAO|nr:hypothetical protein [Hyunsoonleella flava]TBN06727.1 hypothetical protein EYD45_02260 [Hyunsoonleella flava]
MKRTALCLLAVLLWNCQSKKKEIVQNIKHSENQTQYAPMYLLAFEAFSPTSNPYKTSLRLQPSWDNRYNLIVDMELIQGAYFISPNSTRDFKGKFTIELETSPDIKLIDGLIEYPLTKEENDPHPFVNGKVNWVRENTTYTQKIKLMTDEDFTVRGLIRFTIEPRCTLEKIPIVIFMDKGELKFEIDNC